MPRREGNEGARRKGGAFVIRWECECWVKVYPTRTGGFCDSTSDDKVLSNPVKRHLDSQLKMPLKHYT